MADWPLSSLLHDRWLDPAARARLEELLAQRPLVVLDLGARGGTGDLRELAPLTRLYGFEPNRPECEGLEARALAAGYRSARYRPVAVGRADGSERLIVTRNPGASSFLEPDPAVVDPFGGDFARGLETVSEEAVETVTLDSFAAAEGLEYVDYLKMDVQGSELAVIEGAPRLLAATSFLRTEVNFRAMYRDLPLFRDVDAALAGLGFTLLALENAYFPESVRSRAVVAEAGAGDRGEWLFADAVYVRDGVPDDPARSASLVLVLESLNFVGYALEVARRAAEEADLFRALEEAVSRRHRLRWFDNRAVPAPVRRRAAWRLAGRVPHTWS